MISSLFGQFTVKNGFERKIERKMNDVESEQSSVYKKALDRCTTAFAVWSSISSVRVVSVCELRFFFLVIWRKKERARLNEKKIL